MKLKKTPLTHWRLAATVVFWLCGGTVISPAAMSLLKREMFATTGKLTPASPGSFDQMFGTFHQRAGGPRLDGGTAASADLQGAQAAAAFDLGDPGHGKVVVGAWFFIKSLAAGNSKILSLGDRVISDGPTISAVNGVVGAGVPYLHWTPCPIDLANRWVYLGIAFSHRDGITADVKFYYKLPGEPMKSWAELNAGTVWISSVNWFRVSYEANPPLSAYRVGAPSAYAFEGDDFFDVSYPAEIIEPEVGLTWYCNPADGNDANDGTAPNRAWATVAKINSESQHTGIFPAASHTVGDTLIIDTSGAELYAPGTALAFRTAGLTVRAAEGEAWIRIKSCRTVSAASWSATSISNVYATVDTASSVVLWEDDKFMHHPAGDNFAAVVATLSETPGSFWTDGSTLYAHPFGSTDPRVDRKRYERSYVFDEGMAVALAAPNLHVRDIHVGKTCLAEKSTNDPIHNYCMGTRSQSGSTLIQHCYLYYGAKHNLGLVQGMAGDSIVIEDVQAEQGSPYVGPGGQTVFVSFVSGPSSLGIVHSYRNCRTMANCGLVGSTIGIMRGDLPVFYSHNVSGSRQFAKFEFVNCDFGTGGLEGDAVEAVRLDGTRCGALAFGANVEMSRCLLRGMFRSPAGYSLTARNCIFVIRGMMGRNPVAGTVDLRACTFDASGVTSIQGGVPEASLLTRNGPLALTFQNNVVVLPSGSVMANVFGNLQSTDVLDLRCNAYQLSGSVLSYRYQDGLGAVNQNLQQWQMLGYDDGSFGSEDLKMEAFVPQPGSPVIDAGVELGLGEDFSGSARDFRDDIGAIEAPNSYAYWQAEQFSDVEMQDPEVSGPNAVNGAEGLPNLLKFAFGFVPGEDAAGLMPQVETEAQWVYFTYVRLRDMSAVRYEVEESADLQMWLPARIEKEEVLGQHEATETVRAVVRTEGMTRKFLRLRVISN